jgi:Bifunctional DNA primase/polymerase, N-terminal/Primase C terminal 1 (PriCT-1)
MMAAFQEMATAWAAAGVVPLPITADGKRPLVKQPDAFGRRGALQLAAKARFANAAVGFWCGHFNRLTVVDVDSAADSELQYALDTFGQSPVIVRTASGKHHAYYRHNGERRQIKPDKTHPIDILGEGGFCVAPPSVRSDGGRYEFVRGGLSDLANLPTMRTAPLQIPEPVKPRVNPSGNVTPIGKRNDTVFRLALALAKAAESQDELLAQARKANAELSDPPLLDSEVQRAVASAWGYKMADRLMVPGMGSSIILQTASLDRFLDAGDDGLDCLALLAAFRKAHAGLRDSFAASPEAMARVGLIRPWGKKRYRSTIRKLCDLGELEQVYSGGRGPRDPAMYRFANMPKGSELDPNTNQTPSPSLPSLRGSNQKRRFP